MRDNCLCGKCNTDADWSNDNGYKYVLDELKATRAQIDNIIKVIEGRIQKDAIIDEVLNTEYEDDTQTDDASELLKQLLDEYKKQHHDIKKSKTPSTVSSTVYPYWRISNLPYRNKMWYY